MLSDNAEKLINQYFNLPFPDLAGVRCPYFNNAKRHARGQLRALAGKGLPQEIVEEAKILSLQYQQGIFDHEGYCRFCGEKNEKESVELVRKFLIDNDLGIECSGFAAHVLRAHFRETKKYDIFKKFHFTGKSLFRSLLAKLRPAENISVKVLADDKNSQKLFEGKSPADSNLLRPGDILIMLETGINQRRNHILIITEMSNGKISYAHARAWSSEGKYGHGVARGEIEIISPGRSLMDQTWEELGKINDENETFLEAKNAKVFEARRIKI